MPVVPVPVGHRSFYMAVFRVFLVVLLAAGCSVSREVPIDPSATPGSPSQSQSPSPTVDPRVGRSGFTPSVGSPTATLGTPVPEAISPATANTGGVLARIDFHQFALTPATFDNSAQVEGGGVILTGAPSGTWTSGWREPGFAFTRLVPSWNADTPPDTWIRVEAQARRDSGGETAWYSLGRWALGDGSIKRATVNGQRDADARVDTDTVHAFVPLTAYRIRVTLERRATTLGVSPTVRLIAAVASDDASVRRAPASAHGGTVRDLAVPAYSQEIHAGEYPEYDGGGEAWCSPTSTTMILGFWGRGPTPSDVIWVDPSIQDPGVVHAARYTYDATYGGTGNWAFNTAYAANYHVRAFVTQLRSLGEAERFIASGIPLVASINVRPGGLPGFLYAQGTNGHLLVIRGFTAAGDVIANDPAALSNAEVRRVYPRAAFERAWVGGSGGIVYVIHPADRELPERVRGATANW